MASTEPDALLPPALLRKIERLSLRSRRPMRGQVIGARRSIRHGASVEFSEYREYAAGDDPRYVDWKAYGRLEKLVVKLFLDEDDLSLHLLLDDSASMAFGAPVSKLRFGQQLGAALGAIALMDFDRCGVALLGDGQTSRAPMLRGRSSIAALLARLSGARGSGRADTARAVARYAREGGAAPGVLIILSDFYDHGLSHAMLARASRTMDIVLIHIVSPDEIDPLGGADSLAGDVRLLDSESDEPVEIEITPGLIDEYRREFARFCDDLESTARRGGAGYIRVATDIDPEEILLGPLRQRRVLG